MTRPFLPSKRDPLLVKAVQSVVAAKLATNNKLHLGEEDLSRLLSVPANSGLILAFNHADETDPLICLELSRLTGRSFISMCNREAFDEMAGAAGWFLQRLGYFSVERGAHDAPAKNYAVEIVKDGKDALIIFPEGEIFYLNERVQKFHSGAIEIGMQALIAARSGNPEWQNYILPVAIKYHYLEDLTQKLRRRIERMETRLALPRLHADVPLDERLYKIQTVLLQKARKKYKLTATGENEAETEDASLANTALRQAIVETEKALIKEVLEKDATLSDASKIKLDIIDESWKLAAQAREEKHVSKEEIEALREVAELESWRPRYFHGQTSQDRLAEALLKMERELYKIKRPAQLAKRDVYLRVGEPLLLSEHLDAYTKDAHSTRNTLTEALHGQIQSLIDLVIAQINSTK